MGSELKKEALRLRLEDRLSYSEINAALGVPKGTLSGWLRDYPLTKEEARLKMATNSYTTPKKERGPESVLHQMVKGRKVSPFTKAKVSWTFDELSHLKSSVTIHPDAAERWDKILGL